MGNIPPSSMGCGMGMETGSGGGGGGGAGRFQINHQNKQDAGVMN